VRRIVKAAQAGDREAMQELYVMHAAAVEAHVRRIVGGRHDAEDVTQQVFAKLLTELHRYRPGDPPFAAWVLRVAHNVAIDHLRRMRVMPSWTEADGAERPADDAARECSVSLRVALGDLPADQRNVLLLHHLVGLSPSEIALRLGRTGHSVHCLHHRGRRSARVALNDLGAAPVTASNLEAA